MFHGPIIVLANTMAIKIESLYMLYMILKLNFLELLLKVEKKDLI